jgi:tetraacyldisaccharide 4'-kinase
MPGAPAFWGGRPGLAADLLAPVGAAWDTAGRLRRRLVRPFCAPVPVVCIGNLVVGGAGKTPIAIALARWLAAREIAAHVVTCGYGGRLKGPCRVDPRRFDAVEVGDEALLLAAETPTWVARDRARGAVAAAAAGAQVILLDDGFQNPQVAKTLSLLAVDAGYRFGNGRVIPAGPLRENLSRGLARADAVVLVRSFGDLQAVSAAEFDHARPVIPAVLSPLSGERFAGERVVAFAGIGRPARFFASLRALGAEVVAEYPFADHHKFRPAEITVLRDAARRERAQLVTTAKDFVRLPDMGRGEIAVLDVKIRWSDPEALAGLLAPVVLSAARNGDTANQPAC